MTKLSEHFTLEEMTYSDTAKAKKINNVPDEAGIKVLTHTCQYLLEPLRALLNEKYKEYKGKAVKVVTIGISSGFRSKALNAAIAGSSKTSKHMSGECVDCHAVIYFKDGTNTTLPYNELYENIKAWVKAGKISVDQAIQERAKDSRGNYKYWVHIGHSASGKTKDRRQFLKYSNGVYTLDVDLP